MFYIEHVVVELKWPPVKTAVAKALKQTLAWPTEYTSTNHTASPTSTVSLPAATSEPDPAGSVSTRAHLNRKNQNQPNQEPSEPNTFEAAEDCNQKQQNRRMQI